VLPIAFLKLHCLVRHVFNKTKNTMIKNLGGVFGRNPTFNNVEVEGDLTVDGNYVVAGDIAVTGNATITGTLGVTGQITGNVTGNLTGNADTVTNGAYVNVDNNFSVTQTFQTDISVNGMTVGLGAGNFTENLAIGAGALGSNDSGLYNTAIGTGALNLVFDGSENTAVGTGALNVLVDGSENIAFGRSALGSLVNGIQNTAIGKSAMFDAVDAVGNVAIGNALMALVSGSWNVAIGDLCLLSGECTGNVANGRSALQHITTGDNNVALGYQAGKRRGTGVSTLLSATESIFIGNTARASASAMTREIVIGSNAVGLGSNTTVMGVSTTLGNRIFGVASTGQVAPTIASATTIAPTKTITFISGVTPIVTITAPSLIATTGGQITLIPTGMFTTTIAGNIALASAAVISKALIMTYDATTAKWYPSY
jgi:cytoskeletal protein CcmA (bactofilin family)